ncbi:S1C family serine protease [Arachidicoccus sp.]|jgi:serine protease Do|uniref:S1C family serine protease n=1 Tax=Arachidicoccus sp. TaxID=1872624 RepID=UPI003D23B5C8
MRKILKVFLVTFLLSTGITSGQNLKGKKLAQNISAAIEKSYAACVRIWAFDTSANKQMSAPFSGVVVNKDGHILTAAHVVMPGATYQVTFPDGNQCIAIGLGKITKTQIVPDVGMMKIISRGVWPFATMGYSGSLRINEPCISISYPESLYQSIPIVRFGYITSAKNEKGFIQSTCIMEPGDSGGPLFDYEGNVIGLHSAIEVSEKLNFDIPIDLYRIYWQALNIPRIYHSFPKSLALAINDSSRDKIAVLDTNDIYGNDFKKITAREQNTCLNIISDLNGRRQEALGTLINFGKKNKSLIISKSSIVGSDSIFLQTGDGLLNASVIARDESNDLVLLRPASNIKGGIPISKLCADSSVTTTPGQFIASILPHSKPVYSVIGTPLIKISKYYSAGSFGASILFKDAKVRINTVQPGSPADKQGMRTGDAILSIDNKPIHNSPDFFVVLNQYWPGDSIVIKLKRAGVVFDESIVLRPIRFPVSEHPAEHFAGGSSKIRDGFNKVFSHDALLYPDKCGGPIFDDSGAFCGINIARHSRASCLAMPTSVICQFLFDYIKTVK